MKTAVLVDGAFFLKCFRSSFPDRDHRDAGIVADTLFAIALEHVRRVRRPKEALYRVFFYDCPPFDKKMHLPVSGRAVDFKRSNEALFRNDLHAKLRSKRKLALRLGQLSDHADWELAPSTLKQLRKGERNWSDLQDADYRLGIKQKAVDMKVGLDIASLAFKRLADQVVLIAGDSDFVPAAKLARREGIDFILDAMGQPISPHLFEHIDGLHQVRLKPIVARLQSASADDTCDATPLEGRD